MTGRYAGSRCTVKSSTGTGHKEPGLAVGFIEEDNGAGDGIRTRDIDLGKVALYQLSYSRPGGNFHSPLETIPVSNVVEKSLN